MLKGAAELSAHRCQAVHSVPGNFAREAHAGFTSGDAATAARQVLAWKVKPVAASSFCPRKLCPDAAAASFCVLAGEQHQVFGGVDRPCPIAGSTAAAVQAAAAALQFQSLATPCHPHICGLYAGSSTGLQLTSSGRLLCDAS